MGSTSHHRTCRGCDEFVDLVIPVLQERGLFRTDYEGTTLREHPLQAGREPVCPRCRHADRSVVDATT